MCPRYNASRYSEDSVITQSIKAPKILAAGRKIVAACTFMNNCVFTQIIVIKIDCATKRIIRNFGNGKATSGASTGFVMQRAHIWLVAPDGKHCNLS